MSNIFCGSSQQNYAGPPCFYFIRTRKALESIMLSSSVCYSPVCSRRCQSKMQQLWGFNMGYEHHEQPPIAFGAVSPRLARPTQLFASNRVDLMDDDAEANMDPANGRGADQHVLSESGVWTKPEFKALDSEDNYALRSLLGHGEAR